MKRFNQKLHWKVIFIAIPFSFLLLFFVYKYSEKIFYKSFTSHINTQYRLFQDRVNSFLVDKDAFVSLMTSHSNIKKYLHNPNNKNQKDLETLFLNQTKIQENLMQLRLLSSEGKELVRVDRVNNKALVIDKQNLQDKSKRDYFKSFKKLKENQMGVSSLDLNVEYGKIEKPFNATLRVSMPIYEKKDLKALIIINYKMNKWLEGFKEASFLEFYMVDKDGFFILHPNKDYQWSRYLDNKLNIKQQFNLNPKDFLDSNNLLRKNSFLGRKLNFFNNEEKIILYNLDNNLGITNYLDHSKLLGLALIFSILLILLPLSKIIYEYLKSLKSLNLELSSNEDKMKRVLDNTFDAIIMIDKSGIIQNVNKAALEIFLYKKNELLGKNVKIIVPEPHHSNHDEYLRNYNKQIKTKVIGLERELFGRDKNGKLIPVNVAITKFKLENELFFIGTIRDLRSEKHNKKLFQNVFDNTSLGLALVLKDGSFWQLNSSFCNIVGYKLDELKALTFQDITHPDDLDIDLELVNKLINKELDTYSLEKRYIHKDGHIVWINLKVTPIFSDENKTDIEYFIAAIEDITTKKEIVENLKLTKNRLLEAEDVSQTGHWDWNVNENSLYWSDVMFKIFGKTKDSFNGSYEDFIDCVYTEDRDLVNENVNNSFKNNVPFSMEYRIMVNGKIKYIKAQGKTVYENDTPIRMFGTCQDISEIKTLMEKEKKQDYLIMQQAKLVSMGEMVAAIAHQWRQPLNSIGLSVQDIVYAYKYDEIDEVYLKDLKEEIMGQLNYMSQTIDEFRGFFKKSNLIVEFNLLDALVEIKIFYSAQLKESSIDLSIKCKLDKNVVSIDEISKDKRKDFLLVSKVSELKQIIINCISNAKDAIEKLDLQDSQNKKIEIVVENSKQNMKIFINDFAGGIEEKTRNRIFEPYFTTKEMGTGLGLYIAKMIVEKSLKGNIVCNKHNQKIGSKTYKGSSFIITLPLTINQ